MCTTLRVGANAYAMRNVCGSQCKVTVKLIRGNENCSGPVSVVGIASGYRLDGTGIESRWRELFHTCPDRPWGPPSLLYNGYRVFPGGKERPGSDADASPPSSAMVMNE
jgi:hypothetical protein